MDYDDLFSDCFGAGALILTIPKDPAANFATKFQPLWTDDVKRLFISEDSRKWSKELCYLIDNNFVRVAYRQAEPLGHQPDDTTSNLIVRVYIIPEDYGGDFKSALYSRHAQLATGVKHLRSLLTRLSRCTELWQGTIPGPGKPEPFFEEDPFKRRRLPVIYRTLPSPPSLREVLVSLPDDTTKCHITNPLDRYSADLIATLYPYQEDALVRMLSLEAPYQQPTSSPLFVPITSLSGPKYFIDPARLVARKELPEYSPTQGGILCEEMGTGKTVICLALILSTLNQISQPEGICPLVTEWSLADANTRQGENAQVPVLEDVLCHALRTSGDRDHWFDSYHTLSPHLQQKLFSETFRPFFVRESLLHSLDERTRSEAGFYQESKIYVTNATLLLVPKMLLAQWRSELRKHVRPDMLRVLLVEEITTLSSASDLANMYDLIILTHERLTLEIARLKAKRVTKVSPLFGVRWLRLVVDEGNVCANISETMLQARSLSAERRWIVTGTPTTNLVNVREENSWMDDIIQDTSDELSVVDSSADRQDLRKLSAMIAGFLGERLSPMIGGFHEVKSTSLDEEKLFSSHIIAPFCASEPKLHWKSTEVLEQLLQRVMVRHRVEDIESSVALPPLTQESVRLDMDPYQAITYNVLQSLIAVNAVDSERKDQDYFFHPANQRLLSELMINISQTCFWHTDIEAFDLALDKAVNASRNSIETALKRGATEGDVNLMTEAHRIQSEAAANMTWRCMMRKHQVPVRVYGLSAEQKAAWDCLQYDVPNNPETHDDIPLLMIQLSDFREAGTDCQLAEESMLWKGKALQRAHKEQLEAMLTKKRKTVLDEDNNASPKKSHKKGGGKAARKKAAAENEGDDTPVHAISAMSSHNVAPEKAGEVLRECVSPTNPYLRVKIGTTTSPKINFVISEMLNAPTDRFIVFSSSPWSLVYLKEALDSVGLPSVIVTTERNKVESIQAFETPSAHRALLLELKHGARGLNLTSANRVIFLEPVWHPDIESQAVKRAHRIGQTRAVKVQTLVMKGTAEEEILGRRSKTGRLPKLMLHDQVLKDFIANPRFLETKDSPASAPTFSIPAFKFEGPTMDVDVTETHSGVKRSIEGLGPSSEQNERPRKRVAFA